MIRLLLRRLALGFATVALVSAMIFAAVEALPGDACTAILQRDASGQRLENCRRELGLDRPALGRYLQLAVAKRPAEELFDIVKDPGCLDNLAARPEFASVRAQLAKQLEDYLRWRGLDEAAVLDRVASLRLSPAVSDMVSFPALVVVDSTGQSSDDEAVNIQSTGPHARSEQLGV